MDFQPIDVARAPWYRRALLPAMMPVNRLLRAIWRRSPRSRSTWFDSRLWRSVWNVNRWFACTPRREPELVEVRFGPRIRMRLDLSRLTDVLAFCYGPGEIEVGHACSLFCGPESTVVDVGGNIGTTALAFADLVRRGRVHVFEPSQQMSEALRENLALSGFGHVVVHPFGLSATAGRAGLQTAIAGNPGSAYLAEEPEGRDDGRIEGVEVRRLDDVLAGEQRIDFVKVDVEGLELQVLQGGIELLSRHRPAVVFEVNEGALKRAGTSGAQICDFLRGLGYGFRYLDRGRLRPYDPAVMLQRKLHNVIAVHGEAPAGR